MGTEKKSKLRKDFEFSLKFGALATAAFTVLNHFTTSATPVELVTEATFYLPVVTGLMTGYKHFIEHNEPDGPQ